MLTETVVSVIRKESRTGTVQGNKICQKNIMYQTIFTFWKWNSEYEQNIEEEKMVKFDETIAMTSPVGHYTLNNSWL